MFGSRKSPKTPWEATDTAVEDLLSAARVLHKTVEPEPDSLGIMGAGSIGVKAETVRQAIERLSKALQTCAAAQGDGKMPDDQIESVLDRIEGNTALFITVLERLGSVHYHRFCKIGMGIPSVVKTALGWIQSSMKTCMDTMESVNKSPELAPRISAVGNRLLVSVSESLAIYGGTSS